MPLAIQGWDLFFMQMAKLVASRSKDPSTQVGAVVVDPTDRTVLAMGYNGLPRGVKDPPYPFGDDFSPYSHGYGSTDEAIRVYNERVGQRPSKYLWAEHAESNAFNYAAKKGVALDGMHLYVWPFAPCADCSRRIIQVGIRRVYTLVSDNNALSDRWAESHDAGSTMLYEAKVEVVRLWGKVP